MKSLLIQLSFIFAFANLIAQSNTVGVIQNNPNSYVGYTFFSPFNSTKNMIRLFLMGDVL